jgi:hypothetical protein
MKPSFSVGLDQLGPRISVGAAGRGELLKSRGGQGSRSIAKRVKHSVSMRIRKAPIKVSLVKLNLPD